jgi:hypothetical protein
VFSDGWTNIGVSSGTSGNRSKPLDEWKNDSIRGSRKSRPGNGTYKKKGHSKGRKV